MNTTNPLRSVAPTVDADVLAVLVGTHAALTGARIQKLSGRSYARVQAVLHRLVAEGLVDAVRHGHAVVYSLNREHVLAANIDASVTAVAEVERRLRAAIEAWTPSPAAVVLFGSFARGSGGTEGDVDLLLVRPNDIAEDDAAWAAQRYDLARRLERWTGNNAQIVEVTSAELRDALDREDMLIAALRQDGRVLVGPTLRSLLAPR